MGVIHIDKYLKVNLLIKILYIFFFLCTILIMSLYSKSSKHITGTIINNESKETPTDKVNSVSSISSTDYNKLRQDYESRLLEIKSNMINQDVHEIESKVKTPNSDIRETELVPTKGDKVLSEAQKYLNIPYVWGGTTLNGMDCSGFTLYVYKQLGVILPRVSAEQSKYGVLVSRHELRPGDLLFFDTRNSRDSNSIKTPAQEMLYAIEVENNFKPNLTTHVGIYVGNGIMIHASSGDGYITYADLNTNYYKNRFLNARRIFN